MSQYAHRQKIPIGYCLFVYLNLKYPLAQNATFSAGFYCIELPIWLNALHISDMVFWQLKEGRP